VDDFERALSSMIETARTQPHHLGLLVLGSEQSTLDAHTLQMDGTVLKDKYNIPGLLFTERVLELYQDMSAKDGAIAFDKEGNLLGAELYVIPGTPALDPKEIDTVVRIKRSLGTRHYTALCASTVFRYAICLSAQAGTVIPFKNGKVLTELIYTPSS